MKITDTTLFSLVLSLALFSTSGANASDDEDEEENDQDTVQSTDSDSQVCSPGFDIALFSPTEGEIIGSLNISVVNCAGADSTASINVDI